MSRVVEKITRYAVSGVGEYENKADAERAIDVANLDDAVTGYGSISRGGDLVALLEDHEDLVLRVMGVVRFEQKLPEIYLDPRDQAAYEADVARLGPEEGPGRHLACLLSAIERDRTNVPRQLPIPIYERLAAALVTSKELRMALMAALGRFK